MKTFHSYRNHPCCEGLNHAPLKWAVTPVCPGIYPHRPSRAAPPHPHRRLQGWGHPGAPFTNHFGAMGHSKTFAEPWPGAGGRRGIEVNEARLPGAHPSPTSRQQTAVCVCGIEHISTSPSLAASGAQTQHSCPTQSWSLHFHPFFYHLRPGPRASTEPPPYPAFPNPPPS